MPRQPRPKPPTYAALRTAVRDTYLGLLRVLEEHTMSPDLRTHLGVLAQNLDRLLARDNGRSR